MKNLWILLAAGLSLAALVTPPCSAEDARGSGQETVFLLTTNMVMFDSPTTRLFLDWQWNANALFRLGLDSVTDVFNLHDPDQKLLRLGTLALFTGAGLIVNRAFSLTAHDENHMEAARSIGASNVTLVRQSSGQEMGIGEFFLEAFNFTSEPGLYSYTPNNPTPQEIAYVAGEGLDTNMLTAGMIAREINEASGHITDLAPYMLNKLWGIPYFLETGPTSDGANYVSLLNQMGFASATAENVIVLNAASCVLSGGFLSLARGTYRYIAEGDSHVEPLGVAIGEVTALWPELTTWLNSDNVSLQLSFEAAWKDSLFFLAGIDTPVLGGSNKNPELTLGARVKIRRLSFGAEVTSRFVKLPFFLGSAELELTDIFSAGIEGFYGEGNTMREAREYPLGPGATAFLKVRL
jgi:hypothetical protein